MSVGKTSIKVSVDLYIEEMYSDKREKAIAGTFALVAVNENKQPVEIFKTVRY